MDRETNASNEMYNEPYYVAKSQNGWGVGMVGLEAEDGSDLDHAGIIGLVMTNFKIDGKNIKKARIRNRRGKWLPYKSSNEALGDDTTVTGIEIVGSGYTVSVHIMGGSWLTSMNTSDVDGEILVGNGAPIDAVWIDKL